VFIIGPDKKIKLMLFYPMTTGRNFDEILRVIDSMQLTAKHKVATPANWKQGGDVIIAGSVNDEDAKKLFPQGWKARSPTCGLPGNRNSKVRAALILLASLMCAAGDERADAAARRSLAAELRPAAPANSTRALRVVDRSHVSLGSPRIPTRSIPIR
jgi:hypothetical protein